MIMSVMHILTPRGRLKWLRTRARAETICRRRGKDPRLVVTVSGRPTPEPLWTRYMAAAATELGYRVAVPTSRCYIAGIGFQRDELQSRRTS